MGGTASFVFEGSRQICSPWATKVVLEAGNIVALVSYLSQQA